MKTMGENDILQLTDVHLQRNSKKQKSLLSSQHSQKYEKQNTKGVIMYIKKKEHVLSLGFSTIIYCTNL